MQVITVKYYGPSNTKGSRFVAKAEAGSVTVGYDHSLNLEENAKAAVKALCNKLQWKGKMSIGQDSKGNWQAAFHDQYSDFDVE